MKIKNWSQNITYQKKIYLEPESLQQLKEIYSKYKLPIKFLGTKCTFNQISNTHGILISTRKFKKIQLKQKSIVFESGVTFAQLITVLKQKKKALQNLPSLPHLNVVGSVITGTHGSGSKNPTLGQLVISDVVKITKQDKEFSYYITNLGILGFIYEMEMQIVDQFMIFKGIYEKLDYNIFFNNMDDILLNNDYVSLFCNWDSKAFDSVWIGNKTNKNFKDDSMYYGAKLVHQRHPVPGRDGSMCVTSGYGLWSQKIYHFEPNKPPSSNGDQLQSEYYVKYSDFRNLFFQLISLKDDLNKAAQITEIRIIGMGNVELSPGFRDMQLGLHFTWFKNEQLVLQQVKKIQKIAIKYDIGMHWGKIFNLSMKYILKRYGNQLQGLKLLKKRYDKNQRFSNSFIKENLGELIKTKQ